MLGTPHPGCFRERVCNCLEIQGFLFWGVQKSVLGVRIVLIMGGLRSQRS